MPRDLFDLADGRDVDSASDRRTMQPMSGRFLCRIGVHRWEHMRNPDDGEWYLECARCHKEKDEISLGGGPAPG